MYRAQYLYNTVDRFIDDRQVWPICVPTYNRPNAKLLQFADDIPLILFIREEQSDLYKEYKGRCRIVKLPQVSEIGETREAIVDWAISKGYDNIFMLDDDISNLTFNQPSQTSTGKDAMVGYKTILRQPYMG